MSVVKLLDNQLLKKDLLKICPKKQPNLHQTQEWTHLPKRVLLSLQSNLDQFNQSLKKKLFLNSFKNLSSKSIQGSQAQDKKAQSSMSPWALSKTSTQEMCHTILMGLWVFIGLTLMKKTKEATSTYLEKSKTLKQGFTSLVLSILLAWKESCMPYPTSQKTTKLLKMKKNRNWWKYFLNLKKWEKTSLLTSLVGNAKWLRNSTLLNFH